MVLNRQFWSQDCAPNHTILQFELELRAKEQVGLTLSANQNLGGVYLGLRSMALEEFQVGGTVKINYVEIHEKECKVGGELVEG
jgi:hypothetical protein